MAQRRIGLGRPLSALLPGDDDSDERQAHLFAVVDGDRTTDVLEAALDLLASALPTDLCGFTVGRASRLGSAADAEAAWALSDLLRHVAHHQLPASDEDDDLVQFAVPCGPEASLGVRRVGAPFTQREVLLLQALGTACLLAAPAPRRPRRR